MKVILKESIENIGKRGDIVNVAAGFGRNYLIPKKLALEVTPSNMKMIEIEQQALQKKLEKEVSSYRDLIERINQTTLTFTRKTGEKDTLFGSVSPQDVKDALDKLGISVEKKKVLIGEPIKKLGDYTVSIKIFQEEKAEVKVEVVDEDGSKGEEAKEELKAESEERETEEAKAEPEEEKVGSKEVKAEPEEVETEPKEVKEESEEAKEELEEMKEEPEEAKEEPEEMKAEPEEVKEEPEEAKAVPEEKKEEPEPVIEEEKEEEMPAVQEKKEKEKETKVTPEKKKE